MAFEFATTRLVEISDALISPIAIYTIVSPESLGSFGQGLVGHVCFEVEVVDPNVQFWVSISYRMIVCCQRLHGIIGVPVKD